MDSSRPRKLILGSIIMMLALAGCGTQSTGSSLVPVIATLNLGGTPVKATEQATSTPLPSGTPTMEATQIALTPVPPTDVPVPKQSSPNPPTDPPTPKPSPTRRLIVPSATQPVPTETQKPGTDFKVIEERMLSLKENQGSSNNGSVRDCGLLHIYLIKVVDKAGLPLPNILVRRLFAGNIEIPPTGSKGPGMSEDVPPRYAGDRLFVMGDTSGTRFSSEQTRVLSLNDRDISNADLIAGGYCRDDGECSYRKANNLLCLGHYSYSVVFQRQW